MRHKIHERRPVNPYVYLDVELLPDNDSEQKAINNVRDLSSNQDEKDLIENYLIFRLKAVTMEWQQGNRVILKSTTV